MPRPKTRLVLSITERYLLCAEASHYVHQLADLRNKHATGQFNSAFSQSNLAPTSTPDSIYSYLATIHALLHSRPWTLVAPPLPRQIPRLLRQTYI